MKRYLLGLAVTLIWVVVARTPLEAAGGPIEARIKASSQRVRVGEPVSFDGRESQPGGASTLSGMYWDFDDLDQVEVDAIGDTVTHCFNHSGAFNVHLTVENEQGERDQAAYSVEVLPDKALNTPSLTHRFENGKTGVMLQSPYTFAFRLEWGNQFFFRLDNCRNVPVSIKIYGYNKNRPLPASVTPYTEDDTFDNDWVAFYTTSYVTPDWQPLSDARYTYDPDSASMLIRFTPQSESVYLAWAAPWSLRNLQSWIDRNESRPEFNWEPEGLSVEGRPIYHVVITDPKVDDKDKKVVWITGNQHGYEMAAGPVCEGITEALFADSDSSRAMLRQYVFHMLPLMNPDAVAHGGYRYNMHDVDLNRNWDNIQESPWDRVIAEPEVATAQRLMRDWVAGGGRLDLYMDFHCLTRLEKNLLLIEAAWDSLPAPVVAGQSRFYDLISRNYTWRRSKDTSTSSGCAWVSRTFAPELGTISFTPEHALGWIEPKGRGPVRTTPAVLRELGHWYVWTIRDYFAGAGK